MPVDCESVCQSFSAIWIADGSTLEALRKKVKANLDSTKGLGGLLMMIVEAFNHQPIGIWYRKNSTEHDQSMTEEWKLARLFLWISVPMHSLGTS